MPSVFTKNLSTLLRGPDPDTAWFRRQPWKGPFIPNPAKRLERLIALNDRLAGLAESNMPFADALEAFAKDEGRAKPFRLVTVQMQELLSVMRKDLQAGFSLSEAMARRPRFFPRLYTELVRMGEQSGKLAQTLRDLSPALLQRLDMQLRFQSYAQYLGGTTLVMSAILLFLARRVLPVFQEILSDFASYEAVPGQGPVRSAEWFTATPFWWQATMAGVYVLVGVLFLLSLPSIRFMLQRQRLGWFAFSLQRLLEGSIPFEEALELAGGRPTRRLALRLRTRILQGHSLSDALRKEGRGIPKGMVAMTSIGESTGRLPEAMGKIADLYLSQAQRHARVLLDVLSPLILLLMGGLVLGGSTYLLMVYTKLSEIMML